MQVAIARKLGWDGRQVYLPPVMLLFIKNLKDLC